MIGITILGATGSIGVNTLDVIGRHPDRYRVVALTAARNVQRMLALCLTHRPAYAVMADAAAAEELHSLLRDQNSEITVLSGEEGLKTVASLPEVDYVMAAIVGAAGLMPTLAAAGAGKRIMLANKEALVMAGAIFMDVVRQNGAELLPVDSEHNAIFQCMPSQSNAGLEQAGVTRILLTASGGPFRETPLSQLDTVTPEQAIAHPNWVMGRKISVDSATMMNKGLEVIEACWLFNASPDVVEVVVHPQSVIHSMVEYRDGSVIAQLGSPDMRTPIAYALAWPDRIDSGVETLDMFKIARLDFEPPDLERFPCLRLAYDAVRAGGTGSAILNAANEVAVSAFLNGEVRYTAIAHIIEDTLTAVTPGSAETLEAVVMADRAARSEAHERIKKMYN